MSRSPIEPETTSFGKDPIGFAVALADAFLQSARSGAIEHFNRSSYEIGDGTEVALRDMVRVPESCGAPRGGTWGEVVSGGEYGLGLRFDEKVGKVTREFFEWNELMGARATASSRTGRRKLFHPPRAAGIRIGT